MNEVVLFHYIIPICFSILGHLGCTNDVKNVRKFLVERYGFSDSPDCMVRDDMRHLSKFQSI